jgi:hypothetical protein
MTRSRFANSLFIIGIIIAVLGCITWYRASHGDAAPNEAEKNLVSENARGEINQLASLGYLGGYRPPDQDAANLTPQSNLMESGLTLYTSGDTPSAYLVDASGKVLHSWVASFDHVFPNLSMIIHKNSARTQYWRYAALLRDGSLLVIFDGLGLAKIDRDSHLIWAKENHAHHDLAQLANDNLMVLTREIENKTEGKIFTDFIVSYDGNGNETGRISILNAILQSKFKDEILGTNKLAGDILHTNSLQVLDGSKYGLPKGVSSGDILISIREKSVLAVINPASKTVVWTFRGSFRRQHFARVSEHSKLYLFDNTGLGDRSRVLSYSWPDLTLEKDISALPNKKTFFSDSMGLAKILSNGNWFIVESEGGHIFELTSSGQLAWSFSNPHRTGHKDQLIATIPHAERIPFDDVKDWLKTSS